jgi:uncharacterized protein (TIGR02001 family)
MQSNAPAQPGRADSHAKSCAAAAALWLLCATGGAAQADDSLAAGSISLGARSGLAAGGTPVRAAPQQEDAASPVELNVRAGFASDYIFRGVTLSARHPAVGAALEATRGIFYAAGTLSSVKLPTQPAAEITMGGGIRPTFGDVTLDLGWTYLLYPGETVPPGELAGIDFWEAAARADFKITEMLRAAGGLAYSPNYSNTGAWSKYAAFGLGVDLPGSMLPQDVSVSLTGAAGYFWFGNQSEPLGGFPLPAYFNWHAGVTVTRKIFNFDLRYYDTNLSRENCFISTGDPGATPGGAIDPVRNPDGLTSKWCSPAVVGKLWFALN